MWARLEQEFPIKVVDALYDNLFKKPPPVSKKTEKTGVKRRF